MISRVKFLLALSALLITVGVVVLPQKNSTKPKQNSVKKPPAKATVDVFSSGALDESLDNLPPQYRGNSFVKIYNSLISLPLRKSEFESTSDYNARVDGLLGKRVVGTLSAESSLAFSYADPGGLSFDSMKAVYDADKQWLNVSIEPSYSVVGWKISELIPKSASDYRTLTLYTSPVRPLGSYIGTNAYGTRLKVLKGEFESHQLVFPMCSEKTPLDPVENSLGNKFKAAIKVLPVEAMNLKSDLRVLLLGKIIAPYAAGERSLYGKPTVKLPSEFWFEFRYLFLNIKSIWLYSGTTGKVYAKLANCPER